MHVMRDTFLAFVLWRRQHDDLAEHRESSRRLIQRRRPDDVEAGVYAVRSIK